MKLRYLAALVWTCGLAALFLISSVFNLAYGQSCPTWPAPAASAPAGPSCVPEPKGTGKGLIIRANLEGTMAGYFCKADGKWKPTVVAATWDGMRKLVIGVEAARELADADPAGPVASAQQTLAQNVTMSINDPRLVAVWCPFYAELMAGKPADDRS